MPTQTHRFPTPGPITLDVQNPRGSVAIVATDTTETVVEVATRHEADVAQVELAPDGRSLRVHVERRRFGKQPRVGVTVRVPPGSTTVVHTASASIETDGPLARIEARTASGSVQLGDAPGDAVVHTASGSVRIGDLGGSLDVLSASGSIRAASVGGGCTLRTASGAVGVDTLCAAVKVKTASGAVRLRDVVAGPVEVSSTSGSVRVGVRRGTLVWLDLSSVSGGTRSDLTTEDGDGEEKAPLSLTVRTVSGSIVVSPSDASAVTG